MKALVVLYGVTILALWAWGQSQTISSGEATNHIGESVTVCGKVISARYAEHSKGAPTFLDLDEAYPHEVFTVLIWGSTRQKFGNPEVKYRDKTICVTAKITEYRGLPEAVLTDPAQIHIR